MSVVSARHCAFIMDQLCEIRTLRILLRVVNRLNLSKIDEWLGAGGC